MSEKDADGFELVHQIVLDIVAKPNDSGATDVRINVGTTAGHEHVEKVKKDVAERMLRGEKIAPTPDVVFLNALSFTQLGLERGGEFIKKLAEGTYPMPPKPKEESVDGGAAVDGSGGEDRPDQNVGEPAAERVV